MADMGAQVIKVEAPTGDSGRYAQRLPQSAEGKSQQNGECIDTSFTLNNRGKKSITINLVDKRGQAIVQELAKKADVLLTNLLPGRMAKYGLDYDQINSLNPQIIYASVSGWGLKGPDADKMAFDMTSFFARGGILSLLQAPGAPPVKPRSGAGDHQTGLATLSAILAALLQRHKTGKGCFCEASLLRTATWNIGEDLAPCLIDRKNPPKIKQSHDNPMTRIYHTSDDRWLIVCMPINPGQYWPKFCSALGKSEWATDDRYNTQSKRMKDRVQLGAAIQKIIDTDTMASWLVRFEEAGCIAGPISEISEVVDDAQLRDNGAFQKVTHPVAGTFDTIAAPFSIPGSAVFARGPGPEPGADTSTVLSDRLGLGEQRVQELMAAGVVGFKAVPGSPLANWEAKTRARL
eukprot:gnl/MRDRNA2_/MRDRNA2_20276_c0_seq1.p1 gnl/MRDRNA2_/MRDRNA2_20276_c0~~gnl/MRDRNA2_/MRDRNA2_20276_c0_seq1.p1  ORF type:complete len:443 (+),score=70.62 gnl/MRDRNA2_/MRDRNA2_20276_c0_seq1:115-1329(+)